MSLQAITVLPETGQPPTGLIVLLHGWGSNALDVNALATLLKLPTCEMIFPNAPLPHPSTIGGRMWYAFPDRYSFQSTEGLERQADLASSARLLTDWIKALPEQTGVPLSRTILGGFSQGGAMTLQVGTALPLAGLMVLSGYLHTPIQSENFQASRLLVVHGRQDQAVPLVAAHQARERLLALGAKVDYRELDIGHEIPPVVVDLMRSFIIDVFDKNEV